MGDREDAERARRALGDKFADVDAAELRRTLAQLQKQLKLLTLKEALVRDTVQDDVDGFEALKAKVDKIEAENAEFFEVAVKKREIAAAPAVMANLRRPSAMPFKSDTDLHGFQMTISRIGKEEEEELDTELEEDYQRAALQLASVLASGTGVAADLTDEEKRLLDSINGMKQTLAVQDDERAGQNEHRRAEAQLQKMLAQASVESVSVMHTRAAVASAEAEASEMVERAQARRLATLKVAEDSRAVLSKAGLALKRLGRSEWSEIKAQQAPSLLLIKMMGAVRLLLADVKMDDLTPNSELPMDWKACIKLLGHTRFVSRLLKLTRGSLTVPEVVYTIISRQLSLEDLQGIDDGRSGESVAGGSEISGSDTGEAALLRQKKSHSVKVLGEWIGALLSHKEMAGVMERARTDLIEAEGELKEAAELLRFKAAEAKRVQQRMHKINSKISGLIAAQEAVPHRQALARLHEYQKLREEVDSVEQAHADIVEKLNHRLLRESVTGSAGTPRRAGAARTPKDTSRVASDVVELLDRIKRRHREQVDEAREYVYRLGNRAVVQKEMTTKALTACTNNDMPTLQELLREQTAHAAMHPNPRDQYTILECKDLEGRRPLHYVCCHGCYDVGVLLLASGANPKLACDSGFTPMHYAAAYGHLHMVVMLNQFDPSLCHLVDEMGQTPLHVASQQGNPTIVSLLLREGADPRATDYTGKTALELAANSTQENQEVRRILDKVPPPPEDMRTVLQKTLEDLDRQFMEADAEFDALLEKVYFNTNAEGDASSSSSDSEPSDTESDEDRGSSPNKSRPSSASSAGDDGDKASTRSGLSQESVDDQRNALEAALSAKRAARRMAFMSPAQARKKQAEDEAAQAAEEAAQAAEAEKQRKHFEKQRLGMSIFAATNAETVATRRRRERAERRALAQDGSFQEGSDEPMEAGAGDAMQSRKRIDDALDDERPTAKPLTAGAGSKLLGAKPEFEPTKVKDTPFSAADFMSMMQGGGDSAADGSGAAKRQRPKSRDGRPISAVGAKGEWASIDVSSLTALEGESDFGPGDHAWSKPHYTDKGSLRVRFWRELRAGSDLAKLGYGRWHRAVTRPKTPPQDLTLDDITPAERVELRSVLPPPSSARAKAVKRTVTIRRKKGVQQGKNYLRGEIVRLEVEPMSGADNFFADALSAGEAKLDAGARKTGRRGVSAVKVAKAFSGDLPWD